MEDDATQELDTAVEALLIEVASTDMSDSQLERIGKRLELIQKHRP